MVAVAASSRTRSGRNPTVREGAFLCTWNAPSLTVGFLNFAILFESVYLRNLWILPVVQPAEIDLDALAHNFRVIRERVVPAKILAAVKANAYGHGATECRHAWNKKVSIGWCPLC